MTGDDALAAFEAQMRGYQDMARVAAKEAAPLVEAAVKRSAAAGLDANDGTSWANRKDGKRALPNVAGAITAAAEGFRVIVTLVGAYVYHRGTSNETYRRRSIPSASVALPDGVEEALRAGAKRAFEKLSRR